ncbi:MAG: tetratricopeptide repeat protein [Gammaproteobacteria bacterium]|nr:tetratricopeptide repeat protein [Gammaproteobacteria bacterium]
MLMDIQNKFESARYSLAGHCKMAAAVLFMMLLCNCAGVQTQQHAMEENTAANNPSVTVEPSDVQKYEEVRQHILNKEYAVAEAKLQAIVAKYPNHSGAWANLGLIYSETNRLELAEKALQKSLELDNKNAGVYLRLALVYKDQGKLVEALKTNQQAIAVDANNAKAHYNIAILYDLYLQDSPAAITHLKKYMDISGKTDDATIAWIRQLERDEKRQQTTGN